jgi:uncharacterized Tic20 family protein
MMEHSEHTTEQRLLGALAHAGIITQGLGLIVGVVVYATQRDKSEYVAFQGLQAAVFQALSLLVVILSWVVWTACFLLALIPLVAAGGDEPGLLFWLLNLSWVLPLGVMGIFGVMGLVGALRVWQGAEFRYPVVGPWLESSGLWAQS